MLTHFQYLDSLRRLDITDTPGMRIFLEGRFMITRQEAQKIVIAWERANEAHRNTRCYGPLCFRDEDCKGVA